MRKYWIDNLRWVTVLMVLFYHVFYFYNNKGVFGGIGGFGTYPECPQYQDVVMYVLYPWIMPLLFLVAGVSTKLALDKYAGKEYMLNVLESREDYKSFMQHWNKALKAVGEDQFEEKLCKNGKRYQIVKHMGIIPKIHIYYSRILWATYAYNEMDIPMDTISQALGHKNGLRVTNFYVKRSNTKVDEANRALIDRLNESLADIHKK